MYFPANRTEVTESWLIDAISAHPTFISDPIENVSLSNLGDGIGQLSVLVLADLTTASGVARQVVVKLHADVSEMHQIAMKYGHYESEINFYRYFSDQVPVRTPEVYALDFDQQQERVYLVMESFADWYSPNQADGGTLREVTIAVEALVGLTAKFWNAPIRQSNPWLRTIKSDVFESLPDDYAASLSPFMERFNGVLNSEAESTAETISKALPRILDLLNSGNQAMSHWDYRLENFFFNEQEDFVLIDWQLMMMTNPMTDFAYLLGTNIDIAMRRDNETELMELFLDGLRRAGIKDYTMNHLHRDYRLSLLGISIIPVVGGAGADINNKRSMALFEAISSRLFQAVEDWDALKVIS